MAKDTPAGAKPPKTGGKAQQNGSTTEKPDRARMDKQVVKAVMASPLVVPWPSIPNHLQKTVMSALPKLIPDSIAEYHVDRARCHRREKGKRWAATKQQSEDLSKAEAESGASTRGQSSDVVMEEAGPSSSNSNKPKSTRPVVDTGDDNPGETSAHAPSSSPVPPEILEYLVLGINENIKALERAIDDLKFRLMIIADTLNGTIKPARSALPVGPDGLLPTAPDPPTTTSAVAMAVETTSVNNTDGSTGKIRLSDKPVEQAPAPPTFIIIPLLSISPQSLVSPIPQYCATYNALVYQWLQLKKVVHTRLKEADRTILGEEREEIRVVPLGNVELEMTKLVGLRRLACLGVRSSHPAVQVLHDVLPKTSLMPPRHKITLPYPTSNLRVHGGHKPAKRKITRDPDTSRPGEKRKREEPVTRKQDEAVNEATALVPDVHFAPLTIKGITTTAPVDGQVRKAKRLEEVRARRKEVKELKRSERKRELKEGLKGIKNAKGLKEFLEAGPAKKAKRPRQKSN